MRILFLRSWGKQSPAAANPQPARWEAANRLKNKPGSEFRARGCWLPPGLRGRPRWHPPPFSPCDTPTSTHSVPTPGPWGPGEEGREGGQGDQEDGDEAAEEHEHHDRPSRRGGWPPPPPPGKIGADSGVAESPPHTPPPQPLSETAASLRSPRNSMVVAFCLFDTHPPPGSVPSHRPPPPLPVWSFLSGSRGPVNP